MPTIVAQDGDEELFGIAPAGFTGIIVGSADTEAEDGNWRSASAVDGRGVTRIG